MIDPDRNKAQVPEIEQPILDGRKEAEQKPPATDEEEYDFTIPLVVETSNIHFLSSILPRVPYVATLFIIIVLYFTNIHINGCLNRIFNRPPSQFVYHVDGRIAELKDSLEVEVADYPPMEEEDLYNHDPSSLPHYNQKVLREIFQTKKLEREHYAQKAEESSTKEEPHKDIPSYGNRHRCPY